MPWEAYQTQALGLGRAALYERTLQFARPLMVFVFAFPGAGNAEIVVAAEVDVVVG